MKILLLGKDGQVGWELQRSLAALGDVDAPELAILNLADLDATRRYARNCKADVIVNAAAYTAVDKAEAEPDLTQRINAEAVGVLAEEARKTHAWLVHYSTDYVFDGRKAQPYVEGDEARPLSVYGRTKLAGEEAIRERACQHLILRTSWVYAARGANFAKSMLRLAKDRDSLKVVADQHGAPTSAELLADMTALAVYRVAHEQASKLSGTYHLVAAGETTWCEYARYVLGLALQLGIPLKATPERVEAIPASAYPLPAQRPSNSRLNTQKFERTFDVQLPHWQFHVARMMDELASKGTP